MGSVRLRTMDCGCSDVLMHQRTEFQGPNDEKYQTKLSLMELHFSECSRETENEDSMFWSRDTNDYI